MTKELIIMMGIDRAIEVDSIANAQVAYDFVDWDRERNARLCWHLYMLEAIVKTFRRRKR